MIVKVEDRVVTRANGCKCLLCELCEEMTAVEVLVVVVFDEPGDDEDDWFYPVASAVIAWKGLV